MKKHMKGQAAMEYLMTYGWAILVLVIVLAALWYLLPTTQEQCIFQQGFECEGGVAQIYVDDAGELYVAATIHNKFGQTLEGIEVLCTNVGKGDVDSDMFAAAGAAVFTEVSVGPGASFDAIDVPCVDEDGNMLSSTEGAAFKGVLAIRYSLESDPDPTKKHVAPGSISGTVIK